MAEMTEKQKREQEIEIRRLSPRTDFNGDDAQANMENGIKRLLSVSQEKIRGYVKPERPK